MSRELSLLHPRLRELIPRFLSECEKAGLCVRITDAFRTRDEQEALYWQGRTSPGAIVTNARFPLSSHNWGIAFDFCRAERGREYDDSDGFFEKTAAVGKRLGLSWGGDWKSFPDRPHLELSDFETAELIKIYRDPAIFIASWGDGKEEEMRYKTAADAPEYARETLYSLMRAGLLAGDGNPDLDSRVIDLGSDAVRTLVICRRMVKEGI